LIEARVAAHPERIAVICDHDRSLGTSTLTFAQLNERVNQLAHCLRAKGVQRGSIVGLMVERSFAMTIGILAIIKAGGAYLPLAPDLPPDRIGYMLKDGGVEHLLVHGKTANRLAFAGCTLDLDDPALYRGETANPVLINQPQDLAYVIYTSG